MRHTPDSKLALALPTAVATAAALIGGALAGGCDAQQSPRYQGEPLATITGEVVSERSAAPPPAKVIANWGDFGAMFGTAQTSADLTGTFPEMFTLTFFDPPPSDKLFLETSNLPDGYYDPAHESAIALGHILVVKGDGSEGPDAVIGGAENYAVLYAEADVQPNTAAAAVLQGTPKAGYHVLHVSAEPGPQEKMTIDCEVAAVDTNGQPDATAWKACGLNTRLSFEGDDDTSISVRLVDDVGQLKFPPFEPAYLLPGTIVAPPPSCNPMLDPMCMP